MNMKLVLLIVNIIVLCCLMALTSEAANTRQKLKNPLELVDQASTPFAYASPNWASPSETPTPESFAEISLAVLATPTKTPTPSGNTVIVAGAGDIACGPGSQGAACKHM